MIYVYSYIVFVVVLFHALCWGLYITSSDYKEYRYLMVGDILIGFVVSVIPVLNLYSLYLVLQEFGPWDILNRFMSIKIFDGSR
jgi:hypothetical protein